MLQSYWIIIYYRDALIKVHSRLICAMYKGSIRLLESINMKTLVYWFKFILFYLITKIRPWISSSRTSGFGKRKIFTMVEKEQVRDFLKDGYSIDASYFNGFDYCGRFLGLGMQRRPGGSCESIFFVRVPELSSETLVLPINPSTLVTHIDNEWKTDRGLHFDMREPMRRWRVTFNGEAMESSSKKTYQLKLDLEWNRKSAIFDADTDMDNVVIASSIASQDWTRELFRNLRELHQTHYEIFGELRGTISMNNSPTMDLTLVSMKDRSYGKQRNWGDFRRYILHYLATEDGLYIGCHFVSIFKTFSHLTVGFVVNAKGKKVAIRYCSKTLDDIGEDGLPFDGPYSYECVDVEGNHYKITVQVKERVNFFCGEQNDGTLFSTYVTGEVNDVRMVGMCEYEYNTALYGEMITLR